MLTASSETKDEHKERLKMNLKEIEKDVIYTVIGDRIAVPQNNFKWLIEQAEKVERYENAINLAKAQLEESESIPFALDALREGLE
jgi:hypothetical protein